MTDIFPVAAPSAEISGSDRRFPIRRIFCVGKNYADHAREMGGDPEREPPFFFSKPADAVVPGTAEIAMPPRTANLHHEIELVVAIGKGGANIALDDAPAAGFGYAVGNDLAPPDLQAGAKATARPVALVCTSGTAATLAKSWGRLGMRTPSCPRCFANCLP